MEATEIKGLLEGLKEQINKKADENIIQLKELNGTWQTEFKTETKTQFDSLKEEFEKGIKSVQDHADKLDIRMQEKQTQGHKEEGFDFNLRKALTDNLDGLKDIKGKLKLKVAGDMFIATNLTGRAVATYQPGIAMIPSQAINFADLVQSVQSATGIYVIYRETGSEGVIDVVAPGVMKPQIDYDFTEVIFNASYIAGCVRFAKQMAQDLPFLTSFLPAALRRDYYKAENRIFFNALAAVALPSTSTGPGIERIVNDIAELAANNYVASAVVVNPKDWALIALNKNGTYDLPGIVTIVNGNLTVNGVPVYSASWMPIDTYIVGDWSYAKRIVVDGLSVEFFEQDVDNVCRNMITARVEARVVLAVELPQAFIIGDFGNVPSV